MRGLVKTAIGGIAIGAVAYGIYLLQFFLIYPSSFPPGSRTQVDLPSDYDLPYEDVRLKTIDGETIRLYAMVQPKKARKTVLMLGPNAGNIGMALPMAARFYEKMDVNVVMLSYRGYGLSTGKPSEQGIKIDALTTINWIENHSELRDTELILYGRSLGGAVAIYIASLKKPFLRGLIVENTFLSIPKLLPSIFPIAIPFSPLLTQRWESYKIIPTIDPNLPTLFLAGGRDELIPPAQFKELFNLCGSHNKEIKVYEKGTHNDTIVQRGYWSDVANFIASL